jgi:hypothetical protein
MTDMMTEAQFLTAAQTTSTHGTIDDVYGDVLAAQNA